MSPELEAATVELLRRFCLLIRTTALYDRAHEAVLQAADEVGEQLANAEPPFALQVFPDAVLRDREPIHLELELFRKVAQLAGAMGRWKVGELVFAQVPEPDALIELAHAVVTATHVNRTARKPDLAGIALGAVWRPDAPQGPSGEVALELFAGVQLVRACEDAERLIGDASSPWAFRDAEALSARLERCIAAGPSAWARALELQPPPWGGGQRSVAFAFYVGVVLARMQVGVLTQRAALHAALAAASPGLLQGLSLPDAARVALLRMQARAVSRCDPHQLRVRALLTSAAQGSAQQAHPIVGLLHAAYVAEHQRVFAEPGVQLSRVDLHAWLASALGTHVHPHWGKALLSVLGVVPAGSHVLADGRLGFVLGPSRAGDPLRPRVLVGGELATPEQPVQMCSPLASTPWAK